MATSGLQIALSVPAPDGCPAGEVSAATQEAVESVRWSPGTDGAVTEEFTAPAALERGDLEPIFEAGERTRYRFSRESGGNCVCELVERRDCPLEDVRAAGGRLHLNFYAPDVETVRSLVTDIRDGYGDVHVKHLHQSGELDGQNLVYVDTNRLTDRQREVLATAADKGYFAHPREANGSEVADELGITLSTFSEHLAIAQSKLLDAILEGG